VQHGSGLYKDSRQFILSTARASTRQNQLRGLDEHNQMGQATEGQPDRAVIGLGSNSFQ
jgi:hypothetical protein